MCSNQAHLESLTDFSCRSVIIPAFFFKLQDGVLNTKINWVSLKCPAKPQEEGVVHQTHVILTLVAIVSTVADQMNECVC